MRFPPIKADRALLWITLHADGAAADRYRALHEVLRACRLHPLDTTAASALVIVEEAAFRAHLDEVRAVLGSEDALHLIAAEGARLSVEAITHDDTDDQPASQRPPWLTR